MRNLTNGQIARIVNRYIGVQDGYLGDFSYRTHANFYLEYCDLDCDPYQYDGTTRQRFIQILSSEPPNHQAIILKGVIEKFPVGEGPSSRTVDFRDEILLWAEQLGTASPIATPDLNITSDVVERALSDAEALILSSGPTSSVDRVHTALHGYLEALCRDASIPYETDSSMTVLFKKLREAHPKLRPVGPRATDITKILRASSSILDALDPVRNRASVAHPNEQLLEPAEAMLVINIVRTLLHYIDGRIADSS